jgi:GR25 family glycosyltransferase involved in LPS biosynthesis
MIDKVYLLSHPAFDKRRKHITERLNYEGISYEIIENFSPEELDYEEIVKNSNQYYPIIIQQIKYYSYYNYPKKISPGSLSLVLKHINCWEKQRDNHFEKILILEDDCEIPNNFISILEKVSSEMRTGNYDIVMLGGFSDFVCPNVIEGNSIHYHPLQKTRCTHAYLVDIKCVDKLISGFGNINNPIDIKMNEVIQLNQLKVAWLEPGLKQIEV